MCPDNHTTTLFVADNVNRCVKAVAPSSPPKLVYQCGSKSRPRALQITCAGSGGKLLLVEWVEEAEVEPHIGHYELVVAVQSEGIFKETCRLPLPFLSTYSATAIVSMCTSIDGFVLIGNHKARALEVIETNNGKDIERLEGFQLDFMLWQFSMKEVGIKDLLVATDGITTTVRILKLTAFAGQLVLQPFSVLNASGRPTCSLLFGNYVLLGIWNRSSESHVVQCIPLYGKVPQQPQIQSFECEVRIECWYSSRERVLLFDSIHMQLQSFK